MNPSPSATTVSSLTPSHETHNGDGQSEMILNELKVTSENICIRLDWKIAELFGLSDAEVELIKSACG